MEAEVVLSMLETCSFFRNSFRLLVINAVLLITGSLLATPALAAVPGDMDGDGLVTAGDLPLLLSALSDPDAYFASVGSVSEESFLEHADVNGDGKVDITDISTMSSSLLVSLSDEGMTGEETFIIDGQQLTLDQFKKVLAGLSNPSYLLDATTVTDALENDVATIERLLSSGNLSEAVSLMINVARVTSSSSQETTEPSESTTDPTQLSTDDPYQLSTNSQTGGGQQPDGHPGVGRCARRYGR